MFLKNNIRGNTFLRSIFKTNCTVYSTSDFPKEEIYALFMAVPSFYEWLQSYYIVKGNIFLCNQLVPIGYLKFVKYTETKIEILPLINRLSLKVCASNSIL